MGPQASCELYRLINLISIQEFHATKNSDFPHVLINSIPVSDLISDTQKRDDTVRLVNKGAQALCRAGATDLMLACNTMHAFSDEITKNVKCRFHSMIDIVIRALKKKKIRKALILSTRTTIKTNLYQDALDKAGIGYCLPEKKLLDISVRNILKFISGKFTPDDERKYIQLVIKEAKKHPDIDTILLACTEMPLIVSKIIPNYNKISSLEETARAACNLYFNSAVCKGAKAFK
ncbi:MAG: amino acid racemase [Alphaproteobacteria bacterium]|nr:amino acid racemase [Alphaproteobacteria bacterium]